MYSKPGVKSPFMDLVEGAISQTFHDTNIPDAIIVGTLAAKHGVSVQLFSRAVRRPMVSLVLAPLCSLFQ